MNSKPRRSVSNLATHRASSFSRSGSLRSLACAAVTVVRADAVDWLRSAPWQRVREQPHIAPGQPFDIALLDPPYDFDDWTALLALVPATLSVIESNRDITTNLADAGQWETIRHRRYGGTVVIIVRRRLPPA